MELSGWMVCPNCPNGLAYSLERALFCLDGTLKVEGASRVGWNAQWAGMQFKEGIFLFGCRVKGGWRVQGWMERPKWVERSGLDGEPKLPKWAGIQFPEGFFLFDDTPKVSFFWMVGSLSRNPILHRFP